MHIWKRSWVYRLWVVGGLLAVVAVTVSVGLSAEPGDDSPLRVALAAVGVYIVGILLLQWLGIQDAESFRDTDRTEMIRALAIRPVSDEELDRLAHANQGFAKRGFGWMAATTVACVASGGMGHHVVGPTRFAGARHGRRVVADVWASGSTVAVAAATAPFEVTGRNGSLRPRAGAPAWVTAAAGGAGAGERWDRLTVRGGPDGVVVERKGRADDSAWLADLWLAERFAAAAAAAVTTG